MPRHGAAGHKAPEVRLSNHDMVMCGPFAALFSDFRFNERNIFSERKQFMRVTERLAVEAPFASVG